MTELLFDLTAYTSVPASGTTPNRPQYKKTPAQKLKSEKPNKIAIEFHIAKLFRLGSAVKSGDRLGVVVCKFLSRNVLSAIWVCWAKDAYTPFDKLPMPYLPSSLNLISPPPVPNLPRDDSPSQKVRVGESTHPDSPTHAPQIKIYYPRGQARGHNAYHRLYWCDPISKRTRHKHIGGGNTRSPAAIARAQRVRDAIAAGLPIGEILALC